MEKAVAMDRSVLVMTAELGPLSLLLGRPKQVEPNSQRKLRRARVLIPRTLPGLGGSAADGRKTAWVGEGCRKITRCVPTAALIYPLSL